jgi:hypothetical protein
MNGDTAIRLISQLALEAAPEERQLMIYEAMTACLPTPDERATAAVIASRLRSLDALKTGFQNAQSGFLEIPVQKEAP